MRVVVYLQERVDPAAARALARLLFGSEPPPEPCLTLEPGSGSVGRAGDGSAGPRTGLTPRRGRRAARHRTSGGRATQGPAV